jgi:hypothetical protein
MRLFADQIQPLSVIEIETQPIVVIEEDVVAAPIIEEVKINPEVVKYINDQLLFHNNKLILSDNDKKNYKDVLLKIIKTKNRICYIKNKKNIKSLCYKIFYDNHLVLDQGNITAIQLFHKGKIFLEEKYLKDVQCLI